MPQVLEYDSETIKEICLYHISKEKKNIYCIGCIPNYDGNHPNNSDCIDYSPILQFNKEKLIREIEKENPKKLSSKNIEEIIMWCNTMNSGLINCKERTTNPREILNEFLFDIKTSLL